MNLDYLPGCTQTRRAFLGRASASLGVAALAGLMNQGGMRSARADGTPSSLGLVNPLHYAPKAKRIIWLYMAGGPSHLETLDPKPKLAEMHGKAMPESFTAGQPIAQLQGAKLSCYAPQIK